MYKINLSELTHRFLELGDFKFKLYKINYLRLKDNSIT